MSVVAIQDEQQTKIAEVLRLINEGLTYATVAERMGLTRGVVASIMFRSTNAGPRQKYIIRLHDLLWQFIERQDATLHGDVIVCAEIALELEDADRKKA